MESATAWRFLGAWHPGGNMHCLVHVLWLLQLTTVALHGWGAASLMPPFKLGRPSCPKCISSIMLVVYACLSHPPVVSSLQYSLLHCTVCWPHGPHGLPHHVPTTSFFQLMRLLACTALSAHPCMPCSTAFCLLLHIVALLHPYVLCSAPRWDRWTAARCCQRNAAVPLGQLPGCWRVAYNSAVPSLTKGCCQQDGLLRRQLDAFLRGLAASDPSCCLPAPTPLSCGSVCQRTLAVAAGAQNSRANQSWRRRVVESNLCAHHCWFSSSSAAVQVPAAPFLAATVLRMPMIARIMACHAPLARAR